MENIFIGLVNFFVEAYNSAAFVVLKVFLGIYLVVLIVDIILLFIARGIGANMRLLLHGENIPIALTSGKKKTRKKWDELRRGLESENENDWKVMIINADDVIFRLFRKLGYAGSNMGEVMESVEPGHFEDIESIKEAHAFRNRIIHEEEFVLSKDQAKEVMDKYGTLFEFFDV